MNEFNNIPYQNRKNVIQEKSYAFSLRIIKMYQWLVKEHKEYTISKQILRSGTSIGANIEEAIGGISRKDFRAKIYISYKEARKTHYWLRLLRDSSILPKQKADEMLTDIEEILRLLTTITKTLSKKNN